MAAGEEHGFFEDWPRWSKPILALAAMILLGGAWIGVPLLSAWKLVENNAQATGFVDYRPMMTVLIAMTTATITGIFVFMTFRIDRGTRLKAERVAKDTADEVVKSKFDKFDKTIKCKFDKFDKDAKCKVDKFDKDTRCKVDKKLHELTKEKAIEKAVQNRIPEDEFRAYVQAVLLADVNGRIVAEYAEKHAKAMDTKTVERLLGLLGGTVKIVVQCAKVKRREDRRRRWAEMKKGVAGWWRRTVMKQRD